MNELPSNLFLEHSELFLTVHFKRPDTGQWLHLTPDRRIYSAPHVLTADLARGVLPAGVTRDMLAPGVLDDLNASIANGSITTDMLSPADRGSVGIGLPGRYYDQVFLGRRRRACRFLCLA